MIIIASYSNVSVTYTADGTQTAFSFPFDYLRKAFIYIEVNEETVLEQGTDYNVSGKTVVFTTAPTSGTVLRIYRETDTAPLVSWADASVLRAKDMTIQQVQNLHILEEQQYWVTENAIIRQGKEWNARNFPIKNVGDPVDPKDATNKEYVDDNFMKLDDNGDYWVGRGKTIRDIEEPIRQTDGATKNYVDHVLAGLSITGDRVQTFNSVALMKEAPLEPGIVAMTTGYHTPNDGGNGVYTIRTKTQSDVEDGGSIIFLDNGNVAELITDGTVYPEQFGAYGDNNHDDATAIQNTLNTKIPIVFSKKYKTTDTISIYRQDVFTIGDSCIYYAGTKNKSAININALDSDITIAVCDWDSRNNEADGYHGWESDDYVGVNITYCNRSKIGVRKCINFSVGVRFDCDVSTDYMQLSRFDFGKLFNNRISVEFLLNNGWCNYNTFNFTQTTVTGSVDEQFLTTDKTLYLVKQTMLKNTTSFNSNTFNGLEVEFPANTGPNRDVPTTATVYGVYLLYANRCTFNVREECYAPNVYGLVLDYAKDVNSSTGQAGCIYSIKYNLLHVAGNKSLILNDSSIKASCFTTISMFEEYSFERYYQAEQRYYSSSVTGMNPYCVPDGTNLVVTGQRSRRWETYSPLDSNPFIVLSVSQWQSFKIKNLKYNEWSVIAFGDDYSVQETGLTLRYSSAKKRFTSYNALDFMVIGSNIKYVLISYLNDIMLTSNMPIQQSKMNISPAYFNEKFTSSYSNSYGYNGETVYLDDLTYKTKTNGAWS